MIDTSGYLFLNQGSYGEDAEIAVYDTTSLPIAISVRVAITRDSARSACMLACSEEARWMAAAGVPGCLECHVITGEFDYFMLLRTRDNDSFNKLHAQQLLYLPGVDRRSVSSLWTPNTRVMQVTEEGYEARDVIGGDIIGGDADDQVRLFGDQVLKVCNLLLDFELCIRDPDDLNAEFAERQAQAVGAACPPG